MNSNVDSSLPLPKGKPIEGDARLDFPRLFDSVPGCFLVLAPDSPRFTILAVTDDYLRTTKTQRAAILGKGVFEVFPENPEDPVTRAVDHARESFQRVVEDRRVDVMGIRKHDIRRPQSEGGGFEERIWDPVNFPVLGADGQVVYIIHRVEDVTESVRLEQKEAGQQAANTSLRDSRRAAINLMEDALAAHRQAEQTSEKLRREVIERQRSEEALRVSEAQFRALFENMQDGFAHCQMIFDDENRPVDFIYLAVNNAFGRLTGLENVVGKRVSDILPGIHDVQPEILETYARVVRTGEPERLEIYLKTLEIWLNISLYSPQPGQFAAVFDNITDRKRAEEALRDLNANLEQRVTDQTDEIRRAAQAVRVERQRLFDVLETLPVYVVLLTPDYRVPFANRFFEERFGKSEGRRCYEYLFNRREPCEICETYAVLKTGNPHHWYWTGPDGRDYDIYDFPFKDSDGAPLILEMGIDITERNLAEDALRQSELRYRTLFETMDEGFCVVEMIYDAEGIPADYRFVEANPAFVKHTGFQNALGKTIRELVPDHDAHWFEIFGKVAKSGVPTRFENIAAAMHRFYDVFAFRIGGEEDPRVGILFKDISDQKRAQTELREANETLEQRTTDLAQTIDALEVEADQRRKVEQALRDANEQLAGRAAQLRALAGELTLTEQRERRRLAKVLHDHLQQLLVGAKFRAAILGRAGDEVIKNGAAEIEGLLDESINASRSLTAELSPPVLHDVGLLPGLGWLARWMAEKYGLIVDLTMEQDIPQLVEDVKVLLFESVRELLFNAVKHARVHTAAVNVRLIKGKALQIIVSDAGPGFDPAGLRPAGSAGGGFGLFSIRERLDLIGGSLEIDSTPGQGSRFVLIAPIAHAIVAPPIPVTAKSIPAGNLQEIVTPSPIPDGKIRVLLADDHAVMRQGLASLLGAETDIEIVGEASDGQEAVEMAGKVLPDVILMDMSMPRLNGIEATRAIHKEYAGIRIIGLSMFEGAEHSEAMLAAGATNYFTKSGPAVDLLAGIRAPAKEEDKKG